MTADQCNKCVYSAKCSRILLFQSRLLNMVCGQNRSKVVTKPKPKAKPAKIAGISPTEGVNPGDICTSPK